MKKIIVSLTIVACVTGYVSEIKAQNDISNIFKAGVTDLNKVANGYLTPVGNCFSAGLGSNWYNTAEVHKPFGFDLTVGVGVVQAPVEDQLFSLVGLTNLRPTIAGTTQAPTLVGTGKGVELNLMQPKTLGGGVANPLWNNGTGKISSFTTPGGLSQYIPTASVQLTLGLPLINDVSVRYVPKVSQSGFELSMWGVGIKHNFKQWIPGVKLLPFDASILVAYNKFDVKYAFPTSAQITPDMLVGSDFAHEQSTADYSNQAMSISANALTANVLISKKLAFITPYLGFGVTKTTFDLSMTGNYPALGDLKTQVINGVTGPALSADGKPIMQIANLTDPIKISSSEVMPNATVGLRLKLFWILTLSGQYTFQKYSVASVGVGLNIR